MRGVVAGNISTTTAVCRALWAAVVSGKMSAPNAALGAASEDRKARLAKLGNLKRKQPADEDVAPDAERSPPPPFAEKDVASLHLSGRNYDPESRGAKLGFDAPPTLGMEGPTLEEQAAEVEADITKRAAEEEKGDKGIDLFTLQPKKPNWDLKRDLDKKLEILNVRTDNAIARLVRERIANQQNAAPKPAKSETNGGNEEAANMDGVTLVEGLRVREQEEEEEERRERETEAEDFL